jgi:hypothetical protein
MGPTKGFGDSGHVRVISIPRGKLIWSCRAKVNVPDLRSWPLS